ncbi:MAG TPA: hypothetical protein VJB92_00640 [Candidatus Paceibacterota bacterium]
MAIKFNFKIFFALFAAAVGLFLFPTASLAHTGSLTNILWDDAPGYPGKNQWAWNDVIGWIDFHVTHNVKVPIDINGNGGRIRGWASSLNIGNIVFDCANTPTGGACISGSGGNWGVDWSGGDGTEARDVAGWAWSDVIGWISFCGNTAGGSTWNATASKWECPGNPTYQVQILPGGNVRDFGGWAWNDAVGWLSFNCSNTDTCPGGGGPPPLVDYKVRVDLTVPVIPPSVLTSSIIDTCPSGTIPDVNCGTAALNYIIWKGDLNGGRVQLKIASSDSVAGPGGSWDDNDFLGEDGSPLSFYEPALVLPEGYYLSKIHNIYHRDKRYFRYRVFFTPCSGDCAGITSPIVKDIIINWSP